MQELQEAPDEEVDRLAQGVGTTLTGLWGGAKGMWSSGMTYGQQVKPMSGDSPDTAYLPGLDAPELPVWCGVVAKAISCWAGIV